MIQRDTRQLVRRNESRRSTPVWQVRRRGHFEPLENRVCLSVSYDFDVMARTGETDNLGESIQTISGNVSINDSGRVAFVADVAETIGTRSAVLVSDGLVPAKTSFPSNTGSRSFGFPQINNSNVVIARDIGSNTFFVREWDSETSPGVFETVARASLAASFPVISFAPIATIYPVLEHAFPGAQIMLVNNQIADKTVDLYTTATLPSISNNGTVAFVGDARGSTSPSLFIKLPQVNAIAKVADLSGGGFRPMVADNGRVVIRNGNLSTSPIVLYSGAESVDVATTAMGYTRLDNSPGISDDGAFVTFAGADANGDGIFLYSVATGLTTRIAGIADNGILDPGETFDDLNGNDVFDPAEGEIDDGPFASFSTNFNRVGISGTASNARAVFLATGTNGQLGIYNTDFALDALLPGELAAAAHTAVVEIGDTIDDMTIQSLSIYDPVNDSGQIAFYASNGTTQAVVRATPPDIRIVAAEFTDKRVIDFDWRVTANATNGSFELQVYRSSDNSFDPAEDIAVSDLLAVDSIIGSGTSSIALHDSFGIDAQHPYVLVVADPSNVVEEANEINNSVAIRRNTIAVVTHGFIPNNPFTGDPLEVASPQGWIDRMDQALRDGGYDDVIEYLWTGDAGRPALEMASGQAFPLATLIVADVQSNFEGPVDVHLIGHSRGAVVVSQAAAALISVGADVEQLETGLVDMTLLDPHPAHNPPSGNWYTTGSFTGLLSPLNSFVSIYERLVVWFQAEAQDPAVFVPTNVDRTSVYHQNTPAEQAVPFLDSLLNLIGEVPILGATQQLLVATPESHTTIHDWYTANVLVSAAGQAVQQSIAFFEPLAEELSDPIAFLVPAHIDEAAIAQQTLDLSTALSTALGAGEVSGITAASLALATFVNNNALHYQPEIFALLLGSAGTIYQILNENELPIASEDVVTTIKGTPVAIAILANDSDPDGTIDSTTVTVVQSPLHGTTSMDPETGVTTYTPNANYTGTDSFTYTVADDLGAVSSEATVEITVVPGFTSAANTLVQFNTSQGTFRVDLFGATPLSHNNFLNYANSAAYSNTIIHRAATLSGGVPFVVQGGGYHTADFTAAPLPNFPTHIPPNAPVQNEPGISNRRGTIAMARLGGQPNSATSDWFINLSDYNAAGDLPNGSPGPNLDTLDGGFTVFGWVIGGDMSVVDGIHGLPTTSVPFPGGTFTNVPFDGPNFVNVNSVTVLQVHPAFRNPIDAHDVNNDGLVTALDRQLVIDDLALYGEHLAFTGPEYLYLDTNGDGQVTQDDVFDIAASTTQMLVHTFVTDLAGNPITSIEVGNQFRLWTEVQDVRDPEPQFSGVAAAGADISISNPALTSIDVNQTVEYGTFFDAVQDASLADDRVVGYASSGSLSAPGNDPQFLFSVVLTATAAGIQTFVPSFDASDPSHEYLLYLSNDVLLDDDVLFVGSTLEIIGAPAESTLTISSVMANEGNSGGTTPFVFTVNLSAGSGQPVTVNYATSNGTATAGSDYTATSGTLTFAPGTTSQLVTVLVNADNTVESDESFTVTLSGAANATIGTATGNGTITNDDVATPSLSITNVAASEGNSGGTTPFVFTVNLSAASGQQVTVGYATSNGTATAGSDYTATSGTLTFAPGTTSQPVTVSVQADTAFEQDETFTISLANAVDAAILLGTAIGTILNDDPSPVPQLATISVIPTDLVGNPISQIVVGSDFLLQAVVQDSRNPPATFGGVFSAYLNVSYDSFRATIPQPATFSFDPFFSILRTFDATVPGQIIGAGASTETLPGPGNAPQKLWSVVVHASAAGIVTFIPDFDAIAGHDVLLVGEFDAMTEAQIDFVSSLLTIVEEQSISVAPVSLNEGDSAQTAFVFTVSLSSAFNQPVTVQYNTAVPASGDVATAGVDYAATSGTLTFAPGTTSQLVTVQVNGDLTVEPNETFSFVLSNPTNATLGTSVVSGTILNDDLQPSLSISNVTTLEGSSGGTTPFVFTVNLSAASGQQVTVSYATSNDTATAGSDYTATSGTLTFAPGTTSQLITVLVNADTLDEANETFNLNLSSPVNATGAPTGLGTITDDDDLSLSVTGVAINEGNSSTTPFVFTVNLSAASAQQVTVGYATSNGTAAAGVDYTAISGTLTFAPGETSRSVTVLVHGDTNFEANETFTLVLSNAVNAVIGVASGNGVILNDDASVGGKSVAMSVIATDLVGSPITQITVGSDFLLQAIVQDTRNPPFAGGGGLFSAYLNVSYDSGLATIPQPATVNFDPFFSILRTFDATTPGLIVGAGASANTFPGPGNAPQDLWSVLVHASAAGVVSFTPSFDTIAGHDVALYGEFDAMTEAQIDFLGSSITITGLTTVSVTPVTQNEGSSGGTTPFVFTVNLSAASAQQVTVGYATSNGTATAGSDYTATSGSLTFAPG
ncbi:MAG: Calx-beta domain-containing protein, partial [Pirellulales bacterium]